MKIELSKEKLNSISLEHLKYRGCNNHLNDDAGLEPYKLYAYISSLYNNITIADIGTRYGTSALALSYNNSNIVDSFDINQKSVEECKLCIYKPNVTFYNEDILTSNKILKYNIISLDVDPHDGIQEKKCIDFLNQNGWDGMLILDDIAEPWTEMVKFWNGITFKKWDVTEFGHKSGTGIVDFGNNIEIIKL